MIHIPVSVHAVVMKPSLNLYSQAEVEAGLGDKFLFAPHGQVVGGSPSTSSMVCMRGHPQKYGG